MKEQYLYNDTHLWLMCHHCSSLIASKHVVIYQREISKNNYISEIFCQDCWREFYLPNLLKLEL